MMYRNTSIPRLFAIAGGLCFSLTATWAAVPDRVTSQINDQLRTKLSGHLHPDAIAANDRGRVPGSLFLPRLTMSLKPSPAQAAALTQFLAEQQDPSSSNFHKWISPEEFGERFGASTGDIAKIKSWLDGHGCNVLGVARARNAIYFNGPASHIEEAFATELHYYSVNGEQHFANATAPSIPTAFEGVAGGIHGLTDFRLKARARLRSSAATPGPKNTSGSGNHYLAPDDFATIYNVAPLYASNYLASGQKIAVVGQTAVNFSDLQEFRSTYNLPGADPQIVLTAGSRNPGTVHDELIEADLDLEWASAVARQATIIYVYAEDVADAVNYAIDQNIAPVISMSYGNCEAEEEASDANMMESSAQQANAQGITWFAASGDDGATDCGGTSARNSQLSVDIPGSIPEVTSMGGTEFNEGTGTYWNSLNTSDGASATSYIPEVVWNDTANDGEPSSSGGGASIFFAKPSWQSGTGVPNDGMRDVPDISLAASADHDGYLVYSGGQLEVVGGTSAPVPAFAGVAALLNGYLLSTGAQTAAGLGNINPILYRLAQTSTNVFNDITSGNNLITPVCSRGSVCSSTPIGYSATAGYDQVTGWGSVNVANLFSAWTSASVTSPSGPPVIEAAVNGASFQYGYAPGEILSVFGTNLANGTQTAGSIPLPPTLAGVSASINGVQAPLYYVSPKQVNLQLPYEITSGTNAVLTIDNNGSSGTYAFTAGAAAPGIFVDANGMAVPYPNVTRGEITTFFITGDGAVSPSIATGSAPASNVSVDALPKPVQEVKVTVAGVDAPVEFIGIPWLVGVTQVNYQVPESVPIGSVELVVNVGGVASPPAKLTVTQ